MEPEEIAVVLSRASELHAKLTEVIGAVVGESPSSLSVDLHNGDGTSEVRSLSAIRDALDILEGQLEALQALQQQQRAERDAGLAEIEESRRVLLKRLKEHKGRDLEIVQEALAFAGGNVPDKEDDLSAAVYPNVNEVEAAPLRPISIPSNHFSSDQRLGMLEEQHDRSEVLEFEAEEAQEDDEGSDGDLAFQYKTDKDPNSLIRVAVNAANTVRNSGAFVTAVYAVKSSVAIISKLLGKITGQVRGPSSKVVLIVVSTLAVLSLTDLGERRTKSVSRVSKTPAHRSHNHHNHHNHLPDSNLQHSGHLEVEMSNTGSNHHAKQVPMTNEKTPTENVSKDNTGTNSEDDFPTCVVRERLEVPFYQELPTPDVLYGRG